MGQEDEYLKWKSTRAVGCEFARYLARKPDQFGQRVAVADGSTPADIAAQIDTIVRQFVADSEVTAVTLMIPALTQLETLVEVALALRHRPAWTVTRATLQDTPEGPMVAFGLSHELSLAAGTTVPSEALVVGPFDGFPATRKAPLTALEIFVGTPPAQTRTRGPTQKAHLASVTVTPPLSQKMYDHVWETSKALRLHSLGGIDDCRAKAKWAFVIPLALAKRLGCEP